MIASHVLIVLCGLPGAGKTKLSHFLRSRLSDPLPSCSREVKPFKMIIVSYDRLLPPSLEHDLISRKSAENKGEESDWKLFRQDIEEAVNAIISCIKAGSANHATVLNRKNIMNKIFHDNNISESNLCSLGNDYTFIIVIDDNMYFRSMRYSYYQLARNHNIGFCQIFVKTQLDLALRRNKLREAPVLDDVLIRMADKFELPSDRNSWEANSCVLEDNTDCFLSCWDHILTLLETVMKHPVVPLEDNSAMQIASRKECLESIVHQSDIILRKLVSDTMKRLKSDQMSRQNLKRKADQLNAARHTAIADIKNGSLTIPNHLMVRIVEGNLTSILSDLTSILQATLNEKIL